MTRKKKVIIGLIAFVAFNIYIYNGAHDIPDRDSDMLKLSEECQLLIGPPSQSYPKSKYYIAYEDDVLKEHEKFNIIAQTTRQCSLDPDDAECLFALYWESSTALPSVKTTTIASLKILLAERGVGMKEHSDRCMKHLNEISSKNYQKLLENAVARKMGYGWKSVFSPFHWYYETFLKWLD